MSNTQLKPELKLDLRQFKDLKKTSNKQEYGERIAEELWRRYKQHLCTSGSFKDPASAEPYRSPISKADFISIFKGKYQEGLDTPIYTESGRSHSRTKEQAAKYAMKAYYLSQAYIGYNERPSYQPTLRDMFTTYKTNQFNKVGYQAFKEAAGIVKDSEYDSSKWVRVGRAYRWEATVNGGKQISGEVLVYHGAKDVYKITWNSPFIIEITGDVNYVRGLMNYRR